MIKKHLDLFVAAFVALTIVMYDLTIGVILHVLHLIFEVLHIAFEWFELGIEHAVEHIFHTSRHGSQVATFYILLLIAGVMGYWLWRAMPRLYLVCKKMAYKTWQRRKTEWEIYWQSLTFTNKLSLISTALGVVYLGSFVVT